METIDILAAIGAYALIVSAIVDAIRRQFPTLEGGQVQLLALAVAYAGVWAVDFRATAELVKLLELPVGRIPPLGVDYLITAAAIMAGAGKLAEFAKRQAPTVVEVTAPPPPT